ncbi:MAG: DUF3426 domain-containing protein [Desulfobacterales bacterium]|jgi:predicted Zn finger-like uncharacterized protein
MIVTCNECESSFNVDDNLIKDTGSKFRCSKCNSVFTAFPEALEPVDDDVVAEAGDDLESDDLDTRLEDLLGDEPVEPDALSEDMNDEFDLDLDFDLDDEDVEEAFAVDAEPVDSDGEMLEIDDDLGTEMALADSSDELELDLGVETDSVAELNLGDEKKASDELPDLGDFADLAGLDDETPTLDDADSDLAELDIDLEPEAEPELEVEDVKQDQEIESDLGEEEELELADLDLEVDDLTDVAEETASESGEIARDLEAEDFAMEEEAGSSPELVGTDELDLSNLDDILEPEEAPVADVQELAGSEDLDLDLDLDAESTTEEDAIASPADANAVDELDLSDLEGFIDSDDASELQAAPESGAEDLEMDLDFQVDDDAESADARVTADELDFSDLEKMLEPEEEPAAESVEDDDSDDLDLQFEIEGEPTATTDDDATGTEPDTEGEIDFLDIEKMLESGEEISAEDEAEQAEEAVENLDFTAEMEAAPGDDASDAVSDLDLDFDLESEIQEKEERLAEVETQGTELESNLLASDDVEQVVESEMDDVAFEGPTQEVGAITEEFATQEFTDTTAINDQTDVLYDTEAEEAAQTPVKKRRSRKPVVVTLVLLILAIGVIVLPNSLGIKIPFVSDLKIPYLSDLNLKIPYLSDLLNPEEQDVAGNLRILPMDRSITAKFVKNESTGQILVINGTIKNEYDHPRSFIKITGKLYSKGKKLAKEATVYCGNVLSETDLAKMNIAAINKRLQNRFGDNRSNLKLKTGKVLPFMIVFDKLPGNLDEYTVEVAGSSI